MKIAHKHNYVKLNKKELVLSPPQTLQIWQARLESASVNRQKQYEFKMKKNMAHAIKWDVIRKKRSELEAIHKAAVEKIKRGNMWMRLIFQFRTVQEA